MVMLWFAFLGKTQPDLALLSAQKAILPEIPPDLFFTLHYF
jgi:hypothetical protein